MRKLSSPSFFLFGLFLVLVFLPYDALASFAGGGDSMVQGLLSAFAFSKNGFCWFCGLYETLFEAMNSLATNIAKGMITPFITLLGVGVLFYIGFKVAGTIGKLQEVDLMQFLGDIFKHCGRAIVAAAIIYGSVQIFSIIITPILAYFFLLTIKIIDTGGGGNSFVVKMTTGAMEGLTSVLSGGGSSGFMDASASLQFVDSGTMAFSNDLKEAILNVLRQVSANLIAGMLLGAAIVGLALTDLLFNMMANSQLLLTGVCIFGTYFIIYVSVPFKLIDCMVRLTFVAALMPLWVILWVFPPTVQYTKNAWEMLLNCGATFLCMGVILVMVFRIMEHMMPDIGDLLGYLIAGFVPKVAENAQITNPHVLLTFALGKLCTGMIKESSTIAQQIVKSYGTGIGQGVEGQFTQGLGRFGSAGAILATGAIGLMGGGLKDASKSIGNIYKDRAARRAAEEAAESSRARTPGQNPTGNQQPTPVPTQIPSGSPIPTPGPTPVPTPGPTPTPAPTSGA